MINLFFIFIMVIALFFILLLIKEVFKIKLCAICTSFCLTWIFLLVAYRLGYFGDIVILSLLMGLSITGIYYLFEKKVKEKFHLFRLPFLLTLIFVFYLLLKIPSKFISVFLLLVFLWIIFVILFLYKTNTKVKGIVKKIIDCCKDW